jgi:hypothetical protein
MNSDKADSTFLPLDEQMTELSLLVPNWQVQALVAAAQAEGISAGQYVRRSLEQALHQFVLPKPRGFSAS